MSQVVRTYPKHPPMVSMQGARPWNYHCTWLVECDGRMSGANVVEFGRISPSGIPVPDYGSTLNMNVDGSLIVDNSVYALDFATRMVGSSEHQAHVYEVDVTWREPNSVPGSSGGIGIRGEHPDAFAHRDQPTLRPPEQWIEFETITHLETHGVSRQATTGLTPTLQTVTRLADTYGPLINANGESLPPVQKDMAYGVLCSRSYVDDITSALQLIESFQDTVNSDVFLGYPPHYAKFVRADTGVPEYYNGNRYYELTVKVAVRRGPWYNVFANEGSYYYDSVLNKIIVPRDGDFITVAGGLVPLTIAGGYSNTGPSQLKFLTHDPVSYAQLTQFY